MIVATLAHTRVMHETARKISSSGGYVNMNSTKIVGQCAAAERNEMMSDVPEIMWIVVCSR